MGRRSVPGGSVLGLIVGLVMLHGVSSDYGHSVVDKSWCDVKCRNDWDPICASDGVTYVNGCFLHKAVMCTGVDDLVELHRGSCLPCPTQDCPLLHDLVCGSDGHTYINPCTLQVANNCRSDTLITVHHKGACASDPANPFCRSYRSCRRVFMPVCGSDGRTYGNQCELDYINDCRIKSDKVKLVKDGECTGQKDVTDPCIDPQYAVRHKECSSTKHPVCGANGRTYDNWRQLQQENDLRMDSKKIDIAYMGKCRPSPYADNCEPTTTCPSHADSLCGSNGKTYINQCHLFRENECRMPHKWIHYLHNGPCIQEMSKEGVLTMRVILFLVVCVVLCAIFVPLYYARRSYRLVRLWNATLRPNSSPTRGPYQLVTTVSSDSHTPLTTVNYHCHPTANTTANYDRLSLQTDQQLQPENGPQISIVRPITNGGAGNCEKSNTGAAYRPSTDPYPPGPRPPVNQGHEKHNFAYDTPHLNNSHDVTPHTKENAT